MPAIFRTDSGIFGDIEASNMTVTGEVRVGPSQTTIDQYISAEVNTVIGDGIDYSEEINNLSGQISGVSGYATGLSGIIHSATGHIDDLSGVVSGILKEEKDDNTAFSGLSGYATGLSGIIHSATGHIDDLSGVVSGILKEEKDDNTAFSGLSGYATGLSGIIHSATGHIDDLSGVVSGILKEEKDDNTAFSGLSGYATGLSGIIHSATGHIDDLSGVVSGILKEEKDDNTAFSGLSGYATGLSGIVDIATGKIHTLSGQITGITGDINEISGFLDDLDTTHYSDSDVATYLNGNLNADIIPVTNSTYDIGSAEKKIRHLYLSNNSLYIGGEEGQTGTQISATPEGGIVLPSELNVSGIKISGAIGGVTPNAENNSIQWNTGTKQWESSDTLHTATGDLYSFYKRDNDIISNVSGSFDALNFKPTSIPTGTISEGAKGQITYDENYVYLCVADNTWKRLPSADF